MASSNPQTWNHYVYVVNKPLNLIDLSGLTPPVEFCPIDADCMANRIGGGGGGMVMGNDIFDAVDGSVGTYLTIDQYGNLGFGFSLGLWAGTLDMIDSHRNAAENPPPTIIYDNNGIPVDSAINPPVELGPYPYTGWQTVIQNGEVWSLQSDYANTLSSVNSMTQEILSTVGPNGVASPSLESALSALTDRLEYLQLQLYQLIFGGPLQ